MSVRAMSVVDQEHLMLMEPVQHLLVQAPCVVSYGGLRTSVAQGALEHV